MVRILRIDMTLKTIRWEAVPDRHALLGGRGLTAQLIADEVDPGVDPLGAKNKLVIAPGLLAGTLAPCSSRLSVGAKSPLTGGIKESNAGGVVAKKLANLGIKAIVLEGAPDPPGCSVVKVTSSAVEFFPAQDLAGLGNYDTAARLQRMHGAQVGILSIGPGGERKMGAASIAVTDLDGRPCRHCGRGGLGAVLGAKGIKALVIDDQGAGEGLLPIADRERFNKVARAWAKSLVTAKEVLTRFGTASLVNPINAVGGLPTRNYRAGCFEGAEKINGATLAEATKSRGGKTGHACSPGCVIRCSNVYPDSQGKDLTAGLEFETIALMGSNLGIDSLDVIAALDRRCDDYGLDTMEMGQAIAVAMEEGLASFGDGKAALQLLDEAAKGTALGLILGQGATVTGQSFGVRRVAAVKGQGLSGYDPRALKGTGVTYATSPMGADHTAGNLLPGRAGVDCHSREGQARASRDLQIMSAVLDHMGLCLFVGPLPPEMELISQLLGSAIGRPFPVEEVLAIGKAILKTELAFNRAAGIDSSADRLPAFFREEPLPPTGLTFDVPDGDLDQVLNA
ncbi:MAG: aldehyde ferredoxin oxidoreductase [Deltaproteobacteria bacterium]|nr:aldehyde ferredoxin oxidoreductase [Deltaproteobacteria bacterium]